MSIPTGATHQMIYAKKPDFTEITVAFLVDGKVRRLLVSRETGKPSGSEPWEPGDEWECKAKVDITSGKPVRVEI